MKKIYLILSLATITLAADAQCVVDSTLQPRFGISPAPESVPCMERSVPYSQTLQVKCPDNYDSVINFGITSYPIEVVVDSMELTAVNGLPSGISWAKSSTRLNGGQNGCITFSGTTTDPVGPYNLGWYGTVWVSLPSPVPAQYRQQIYTGDLNKLSYLNYYFNVINPGDSCWHFKSWPAGVNDLNAALASSFQMYPNPNMGNFELSLNATKDINGSIEVSDITGRIVYTQSFEASGSFKKHIDLSHPSPGLYVVRLRTSEGFTAKTISVE